MLKAHTHFRAECDSASRLAGLELQSESLINALQVDLNLQQVNRVQSQECNECFSLGVGYVFEGSALGALIIKKRLSNSGLRNPTYLDVVTSTAKSRWPRYIEKLDTYSEAETMVTGAVVAFEYIIAQAKSN